MRYTEALRQSWTSDYNIMGSERMPPDIDQTNLPDQPGAEQMGALGTIRQSIFWISLPFGILGFVLPVYGKEIGAGALQIGLFFSIFFFMTVILRPLVGGLLDRFGRRAFFIAGLAGYTLSMLAFAFSEQIWTILLARALQGVASSCLWLAAQAITADVAGDGRRGQSFGGLGQSNSRGQVVGTFIGFGVLTQLGMHTGWKPLFLGFAAAALLATVFAWRHLKETRPAARRSETRPIRWTRNWNLLLLVTLVTGAAVAMLEPVMMIYLQERFTQDVCAIGTGVLAGRSDLGAVGEPPGPPGGPVWPQAVDGIGHGSGGADLILDPRVGQPGVVGKLVGFAGAVLCCRRPG